MSCPEAYCIPVSVLASAELRERNAFCLIDATLAPQASWNPVKHEHCAWRNTNRTDGPGAFGLQPEHRSPEPCFRLRLRGHFGFGCQADGARPEPVHHQALTFHCQAVADRV